MEGEETYKKEIVKPVYKEVVSKVDMVISMDQVDGSTISTSTDGSSSKSRSINLDGSISAGSSTDLATGKKTTSISFGKQVGLD